MKWVVQLDPRGETSMRYRCKHVNLVTHTNVGGELEFLFAAYSAFTVVSVEWAARPDDETPHVVVLQAAIDNRREAEDAPLAPWY